MMPQPHISKTQPAGCSISATGPAWRMTLSARCSLTGLSFSARAFLLHRSFTLWLASVPSSSSSPTQLAPSLSPVPAALIRTRFNPPRRSNRFQPNTSSMKSSASHPFHQEKTMTTASVSDALVPTASSFLREHLQHAQRACITSSFQAEDVVVLHMVLQVQPRIPVLFL